MQNRAYLDTDIILALVKPKDWLKNAKLNKIEEPVTSVFTIIEAEIVLEREFGRKLVTSVLDKIKRKISILSLTENILEKSNELLNKYHNLNIFDSIHLAFCIINKFPIISTDNLFDTIEEIEKIDPRDL